MRHRTAIAVGLAAALVAGARAHAAVPPAEDDLDVVKKAVASPSPSRGRATARAETAVAPAAPAPTPAAAAAEAPAPRAGREPQWFKVRVVDRVTGHRRVTINLPLSVVRVLGDHTIELACRRDGAPEHRCHDLRLADVLRTLESGQELVEVEDDEATVRVWVE